MTQRRPVSELHDALEQFGRRARKLSVARLEEVDVVLRAVASADELEDATKRRAVAERVHETLRTAVASFEDPVDRRVAQAVLATEPEFFDKTVEERRQYVRENDVGFTDDQYKNRRRRVVGDLAESLEQSCGSASSSKSGRCPDRRRRQCGRSSVSTIGPSTNAKTRFGKASSKTRRAFRPLLGVAFALLVAAASVTLLHDGDGQDRLQGMTATELEQRYDGKLALGEDEQSRCAEWQQAGQPPKGETINPDEPYPPLVGPDGTEVGRLQLRKSTVCPTAVWIRVLWRGSEQVLYQIPRGWTLHTVMYRPATNTRLEELDPSQPWAGMYIISKMISSARGCVYGEAYFTEGKQPEVKTATARTACVQT